MLPGAVYLLVLSKLPLRLKHSSHHTQPIYGIIPYQSLQRIILVLI
jgi:hypothetical protein